MAQLLNEIQTQWNFGFSISIFYIRLNAKNYWYVISDMRMPAMNGMKFLMVIKKVNRSITTLNNIRFGSNKQ
jgi:Response regulator containing CheY-like receiver, AAA-type ATPase, and DNA-binding domains